MNETPLGSPGTVDGGGPSRGGPGEQSPIQTRATFLKNWNWNLVASLNRAACERGRAQHGANPQTGDSCARSWEEKRPVETLDFLRALHKSEPFLFYNGNTFADIGRRTCDAVFAGLQAIRRRELASTVAHYVAGVLDRDSMVRIVEALASRPPSRRGIASKHCAEAPRAQSFVFRMTGALFGDRMGPRLSSRSFQRV